MVDLEIASLQASGADVLFAFATQKAAAQAIRHAAEIGWKPKIFIPSAVSSIRQVLEPAGLDNSKGIFTATYVKDPTSPIWEDDFDVQAFHRVGEEIRYVGRPARQLWGVGRLYGRHPDRENIEGPGNDLSRENILKQATNLPDVALPMLLPGIIDEHQRRPITARSSRCSSHISTARTGCRSRESRLGLIRPCLSSRHGGARQMFLICSYP